MPIKSDAMTDQPISLAVRLIGFSPHEEAFFETVFLQRQERERAYFRLEPHNLQDPDLYVANADEMTALIALADLRPGDARPALLIGNPAVELPYPRIPRPLQEAVLLNALDHLTGKRMEVLARLTAADTVMVTERRRRIRLDIDFTDPAQYECMRVISPEDGAVLIVDSSSALRNGIAKHLAHHGVAVIRARDAHAAVSICRHQAVAVVLINASAAGVDPYCLCRSIKDRDLTLRITVIFLVGSTFSYDIPRARHAGADGFIKNTLTTRQIAAVLQRFLPSPRRTATTKAARPLIC